VASNSSGFLRISASRLHALCLIAIVAAVTLAGCERRASAIVEAKPLCPPATPSLSNVYLAALTGCHGNLVDPFSCHAQAVKAARIAERCP